MRRSSWWLAAVLVTAGCGKEPPPVAVHGHVTFRGYPVRSGVIAFTPDPIRGKPGPIAKGRIGPNGLYTLVADGSLTIKPNVYRVSLASLEVAQLPMGLRDPELSGLFVEVKAGADNVHDFHLERP